MEIFIVIAVGAVLVWLGYTQLNKEKPDGSHPLDALQKEPTAPYKVDAPAVVEQPTVVVVDTSPLDVNNDGKVNLEDAKEVVKKTKTRAKKVVDEVKEEVKKKTGRKPRSKAQ